MSDKRQKKNKKLSCLLVGILLCPIAGFTAPTDPVAAARNSAAALYQLGVMWMNGEGVERDMAIGRYWIHLAARHGYPLAQYNLGAMYFDGIGGEFSYQCAQWWLDQAAVQGDMEVRQMAEQALQSIETETVLLPKVYRPVTALECDHLPAWPTKELYVRDIPTLLERDIEKKVSLQENSILEAPTEDHTEKPERLEEHTTNISDSTRTTENDEALENEVEAVSGSDIEASKEIEHPVESDTPEPQDTVALIESDNLNDAVMIVGDSDEAYITDTDKVPVEDNSHSDMAKIMPADTHGVTTAESGESASHAEKYNSEEIEQLKSSGSDSGEEINAEEPSEVAIAKMKTSVPPVVRPSPVLDLGGDLATAPGKHYTLQLSGGTTPDELYRLARRHKLTNYKVYETERYGRQWYVLVSGEYATLTTANQALKLLSPELRKNGPWVRLLKQVQAELELRP